MADKDFFDDEYDKIEQKKVDEQNDRLNEWYSQQPVQSKQNNGNKPLYIVLICIALVLCIVLGWVLSTIFSNINNSYRGESGLFDEVLRYLDNQYYKEVPDEDMWAAMESAGTALLQKAGDQFSRLMSPSTYYDYCNPQSSVNTNPNGTFGINYQFVEGIGMYVYEVITDTSAYGKLQQSDIVVKIANIITLDGSEMDDILTNSVSQRQFTKLINNIKSATFYVLRDDEVFQCDMERAPVAFVNTNYKFEFIEFYFGDNCTNISTENIGKAGTNTKEARKLAELSKLDDTGYIRIKEFSYYLIDPNKNVYDDSNIHSVVDEFKTAMNLFKSEVKDERGRVVKKPFKRLILDLKGNPGGVVDYATEIAGMLATDSKLTDTERKIVNNGSNSLITKLKYRNRADKDYFAKLSYETYFGEVTASPSIVVWTDHNSASASELLTGALLDYKTAVQMGTTTYGKGIAQVCEPLTNYTASIVVNGEVKESCWAIYYTVAEYFSPVNQKNIHGFGYTPSQSYDGLNTYDKLWAATRNYFE